MTTTGLLFAGLLLVGAADRVLGAAPAEGPVAHEAQRVQILQRLKWQWVPPYSIAINGRRVTVAGHWHDRTRPCGVCGDRSVQRVGATCPPGAACCPPPRGTWPQTLPRGGIPFVPAPPIPARQPAPQLPARQPAPLAPIAPPPQPDGPTSGLPTDLRSEIEAASQRQIKAVYALAEKLAQLSAELTGGPKSCGEKLERIVAGLDELNGRLQTLETLPSDAAFRDEQFAKRLAELQAIISQLSVHASPAGATGQLETAGLARRLATIAAGVAELTSRPRTGPGGSASASANAGPAPEKMVRLARSTLATLALSAGGAGAAPWLLWAAAAGVARIRKRRQAGQAGEADPEDQTGGPERTAPPDAAGAGDLAELREQLERCKAARREAAGNAAKTKRQLEAERNQLRDQLADAERECAAVEVTWRRRLDELERQLKETDADGLRTALFACEDAREKDADTIERLRSQSPDTTEPAAEPPKPTKPQPIENLPKLPDNDYTRFWWENATAQGLDPRCEAAKLSLYEESVAKLAEGFFQIDGAEKAAELIENTVADRFFEKASLTQGRPSYVEDNIYHRALRGFYFRGAIQDLAAGRFKTPNGQPIGVKLQQWVKRQFLSQTHGTGG